MEMLQQIKQSVPFKYFTGRQHQPLMVCLGPEALNSSYSSVEIQLGFLFVKISKHVAILVEI